ncbi:hypothetical protein K3495_g16171, partial [Podosphaera aphanis]
MRPQIDSSQAASSVATSANATALPPRANTSKAISTDKAISILQTHASSYAANTDVHRALMLAIDTLRAKDNASQSQLSVYPELCRLITEQTERVIQKIST